MAASGLSQPKRPAKVLVVEDEPVAALSIRTVLVADGHTVELAEGGETALALFEAGQHELVITDFKLGKMDGLELAGAIKERSPATRIILVTAYAEKIGGALGQVSNIDIVLRKPFSIKELQAAVEKVLSVGGSGERGA